jgi:hypothetical protein
LPKKYTCSKIKSSRTRGVANMPERKKQTYSLDKTTIEKIDDYSKKFTGNKSKVIEIAIEKLVKWEEK